MKNLTNEVATKSRKNPLEEFFVESLKDIYWAEKQLMKAIPKIIRAATTEELQEVMDEHLIETRNQVNELEKVFLLMDAKPVANKCAAMDGLISEVENLFDETDEGSMVRDVALIMAAQKIEHYEIATYGTLVSLARTLGQTEIAQILMKILDEEKEANMTLTGVAENNINVEAMQEIHV